MATIPLKYGTHHVPLRHLQVCWVPFLIFFVFSLSGVCFQKHSLRNNLETNERISPLHPVCVPSQKFLRMTGSKTYSPAKCLVRVRWARFMMEKVPCLVVRNSFFRHFPCLQVVGTDSSFHEFFACLVICSLFC